MFDFCQFARVGSFQRANFSVFSVWMNQRFFWSLPSSINARYSSAFFSICCPLELWGFNWVPHSSCKLTEPQDWYEYRTVRRRLGGGPWTLPSTWKIQGGCCLTATDVPALHWYVLIAVTLTLQMCSTRSFLAITHPIFFLFTIISTVSKNPNMAT